MSATLERDGKEEETSPDGSGAYKNVYLAYDTENGIEVAWNTVDMKRIPKVERKRLRGETEMLRTLKHAHIINFFNVWENKEEEQICFTTEIVTSGTLKQYIDRVFVKGIKLKIIKKWCRQILEGLKYLHSHRPPIIHRDIKCDNIFINGNSGDIIIGDLGLSTHKTKSHAESVLGTPEFMAPELYDEHYTEKVDIWAFGMAVLEMATNEYPYQECDNPAQIFKRVSQHQTPLILNRIIDKKLRGFLDLCFMPQEKRLSARDLLEHPFLNPTFSDSKDGNVVLIREEVRVPKVVPPHPMGVIKEEGSDGSDDEESYSRGPAMHPYARDIDETSPQVRLNINVPPSAPPLKNSEVSVLSVNKDGSLNLSLKLLINGTKKEIKFLFDCKIDTAIQVATEMIGDLKLDISRKSEIADAIDICSKKHLQNISRSVTPVSEDYNKFDKVNVVNATPKIPTPEVIKLEESKIASIPIENVVSPIGSPLTLNLDKVVNKTQELTSAKVSPRKDSASVMMSEVHHSYSNINSAMFDSYRKTDFPVLTDYVKSNNTYMQAPFFQHDAPLTQQSGILSNSTNSNQNRAPLNAQGIYVRFPTILSPSESLMIPSSSSKSVNNGKFPTASIKKTTMQRSISHPNLVGNPFEELDKALSTTTSPPSRYGNTPNYTPSQTPSHSNSATPSHYYYPNPNHPFSAAVSTVVSREPSPPNQTKSFYEQVLTGGNNLTESRELPRDPTLLKLELLKRYRDCPIEVLVNRITKYHNGETPSNLPQDRSGMINYLFQLISQSQNQPPFRQSHFGIQSVPMSYHGRNASHGPLSVNIPMGSSGFNFTPIHTPLTHYPDSSIGSNTNSYSNLASPVIPPKTSRVKDPFGYEVEVIVPQSHSRTNTFSNTISSNYFTQTSNVNGARNAADSFNNRSSLLEQPESAQSSSNPLSDYYSKNPFQVLAPEDDDEVHVKQNAQHLENMVHEIERFIPDDISMDERQELEQCSQVNKRVDHLIDLLKTYELQNELNVKSKLVSSHHNHTNSESLSSTTHYSSSENDTSSDILATVMSELVTMGRNPKNSSINALPNSLSSAKSVGFNLQTNSQKSNQNPNRNSHENLIPSLQPVPLKRDVSGNMNGSSHNVAAHSYNVAPNSNSGYNVAPSSGYNAAPGSGYNMGPNSFKSNSHLNTSATSNTR